MTGPLPPRWSGPLLSLLRMVAAVLFILHGSMKVFAWPAMEGMGAVPLASLAGVAGMIEMTGGTLLLFGLFTRLVAFIVAGEMAVAYFYIHIPKGPFPILNGGEPAVLFCFIFLFFAAAGPGPWAIDKPHAASRIHH